MPRSPKIAVRADFNPMSLDSQLAGIHTTMAFNNKAQVEHMEAQDKVLTEIKQLATKTNGRVTTLEGKWKYAIGYIAGAAAVSTIAINLILHHYIN